MLKRTLFALFAVLMSAGTAFAAVEVNSADQAELDGIAGVGPATSRAIIAEREKNGNFKNWSDLEQRVKGIGERNSVKLSAAGLVVNGKSFAPAEAGKPGGEHGSAKAEPVKTSVPRPDQPRSAPGQ